MITLIGEVAGRFAGRLLACQHFVVSRLFLQWNIPIGLILHIDLLNLNIRWLLVMVMFLESSFNERYPKWYWNKLLYGPRQANLVLIAYASSEGSGEPAHPRSLARTSAARSYKQWVKRNLQTESQIPSPSEWLGMRSWNLSWRNARRHKFAWRGSYKEEQMRSTGSVNIMCHTLPIPPRTRTDIQEHTQ